MLLCHKWSYPRLFTKMFSLKCFLIPFVVLFTYQDVYAQPSIKFFRKDYTYIEETDSFYKIHTAQKTWQQAKEQCALEGSIFYYPEDDDEAKAVIAYWLRKQPNYDIVYIGISTPNAKQVFETVDGRPIAEVYHKWHAGEPNDAGGNEGCVMTKVDGTFNDINCERTFSFICKKTLNSLVWNTQCDAPEQGYQYVQSLGSCYKFHATPVSWGEAYTLCNTEQSYMAVINSQEEANYLVNLTESSVGNYKGDNYVKGAVHLGFSLKDNGWQTVRMNKPLSETGYTNWGYKQPDGKGEEKCGSMFHNGRLNDIGCERKLFFICEYEVPLLFNSYIITFGEDSEDKKKDAHKHSLFTGH